MIIVCSVCCTVDEALEMHVGSRGNHCLHIFFFFFHCGNAVPTVNWSTVSC